MSGQHKFSLSVQGMSCASCVGRVERGLAAVEGLEDVGVNLATESAQFYLEVADVLPALPAYPRNMRIRDWRRITPGNALGETESQNRQTQKSE